jgi:hypothetical protein
VSWLDPGAFVQLYISCQRYNECYMPILGYGAACCLKLGSAVIGPFVDFGLRVGTRLVKRKLMRRMQIGVGKDV